MNAPTQTISDPHGNIYLTYKARMNAESRLLRADFVSQALLAWYSVCLIGISLLDLSQSYLVRDASVLTLILSVAVLALSIILYSRNYATKAASHRSCYLELQSLYSSSSNDIEKQSTYALIRQKYENHLERDYEWFLIKSSWADKPLSNSHGEVMATKTMIFRNIGWAILAWAFFGAAVFLPVFLAYAALIPRAG